MTILGFKWPWDKKPALDIDAELYEMIKQNRLKRRCQKACRDNTNYQLHLVSFCESNQYNLLLLTRVAGYRTYLLETGCNEQEAARLVLEEYRH